MALATTLNIICLSVLYLVCIFPSPLQDTANETLDYVIIFGLPAALVIVLLEWHSTGDAIKEASDKLACYARREFSISSASAIGRQLGILSSAEKVPFPYEPLEGYGSIRVLEIERKALLTGKIVCKIHHISFLNEVEPYKPRSPDQLCSNSSQEDASSIQGQFRAPDYMTLSYTWGRTYASGEHLTHEIECNGKPMRIMKNLHDALWHIREILDKGGDQDVLISKRPFIWADAICINQEDNTERSQQVALMAEIYRHSQRLIIWLGDITDDEGLSITPDFLDELAMNTLRSRAMGRNLNKILQSPWFKRRWIVQEVAVTPSNKRFVLMGRHLFQDTKLLQAAISTNKGKSRSVKALMPETKHASLLYLLCYYRDLACADPQDTIYALRNISVDGADLTVDYKRGPEKLFRSFASHCIERGEVLVLLACATAYPSANLPSWVPCWSARLTTHDHKHENALHWYCFKGPAEYYTMLLKTTVNCRLDGDDLLIDAWVTPAAAISESGDKRYRDSTFTVFEREIVENYLQSPYCDIYPTKEERIKAYDEIRGLSRKPTPEEEEAAAKDLHNRARDPRLRSEIMIVAFPKSPMYFLAHSLTPKKVHGDESPPLRLLSCGAGEVLSASFRWKYFLKMTIRIQ